MLNDEKILSMSFDELASYIQKQLEAFTLPTKENDPSLNMISCLCDRLKEKAKHEYLQEIERYTKPPLAPSQLKRKDYIELLHEKRGKRRYRAGAYAEIKALMLQDSKTNDLAHEELDKYYDENKEA